MEFLTVKGDRFVTPTGEPVVLRGVGLGGWLSMENWITGFPAYEQAWRKGMQTVLGPAKADYFFDRYLTHFFGESDARFLSSLGLNAVRLPFPYRLLEDDMEPFALKESGFQHLDRAIETLAGQGIYTILDLHALPGWQNMGWHADNPAHVNLFWQHRHFQERVVHMWRELARRYRGNANVAGYNLINEPVWEDGALVERVTREIFDAVREADPDHIVILDGNRYGTDFSLYREVLPNVVYSPHWYVLAGFTPNARYPGWCPNPYSPAEVLFPPGGGPPLRTPDEWWQDRAVVDRLWLEEKTVFMRETGTPILIGEFNVVFTGDPELDAMRAQIMRDQIDCYERDQASWIYWGFKDIGLLSPLTVDPDSEWMQRVRWLVEKKLRLGVDEWGRRHDRIAHVMTPLKKLFEVEFPDYYPYPWGPNFMIERLVTQVLFAEALLPEFCELFRDMTEPQIDELMQSFRFENCRQRPLVIDALARATGSVPR